MDFVIESYNHTELDPTITNNLPTAAFLTGINQPDHYELFKTFSNEIVRRVASHVVIIQSRDCPTMKSAIESMVEGLMMSAGSIGGQYDEDDVKEKVICKLLVNV